MTTFDFFRRHRLSTRVLGWLLAALVPLQAVSACVLGAAGPLHTHRVVATANSLVLEDVRRAQAPPSVREVHVATAFGHFHAGAARHVHRADDGSVIAIDDGGIGQAQGADRSGTDAGAASPDGLLFAPIAWIIPATTQARPAHTSWPWLISEPEPFEKPPRST